MQADEEAVGQEQGSGAEDAGTAAIDAMCREFKLSPRSDAEHDDGDAFLLWEEMDRLAERRARRRSSPRSRSSSGQCGAQGGSLGRQPQATRRGGYSIVPPRRLHARHLKPRLRDDLKRAEPPSLSDLVTEHLLKKRRPSDRSGW